MRVRFWLFAMDLFDWLGWGRAYSWALSKASDATDWGAPSSDTVPESERPF